jgi:HTH-type transcriptional regulator / antitoxin HigA
MILTFDRNAYCQLLSEFVPKVIDTEEEYDRALAAAEQLTFAKELALEHQALYKLLVMLIEAYEAENYPMDRTKPHEILQHIMEASGIRQADLVGIVGSSGVVSEVVNGKRAVSKGQAKALGEFLKVSPDLFI